MSKKLAVLFLVVLMCAVAVPVLAQNATDTGTGLFGNGDYKTYLWSVVAWLFYAISGGFLAFVEGKDFDSPKLIKSFVWALVVATLAIVSGLSPGEVTVTYAGLIPEILAAIGNTGVYVSLIIGLDKGSRIVKGLYDRWKEGAAKATSSASS